MKLTLLLIVLLFLVAVLRFAPNILPFDLTYPLSSGTHRALPINTIASYVIAGIALVLLLVKFVKR